MNTTVEKILVSLSGKRVARTAQLRHQTLDVGGYKPANESYWEVEWTGINDARLVRELTPDEVEHHKLALKDKKNKLILEINEKDSSPEAILRDEEIEKNRARQSWRANARTHGNRRGD